MGNDCELRISKRKILNGTKDMQIQEGLCILVQEGKITDMIVTAKNPLGRSVCSAQSGNGCHRRYDHRSSKDQKKKTGRSRAGQIPVEHMISNHSSNILTYTLPLHCLECSFFLRCDTEGFLHLLDCFIKCEIIQMVII